MERGRLRRPVGATLGKGSQERQSDVALLAFLWQGSSQRAPGGIQCRASSASNARSSTNASPYAGRP